VGDESHASRRQGWPRSTLSLRSCDSRVARWGRTGSYSACVVDALELDPVGATFWACRWDSCGFDGAVLGLNCVAGPARRRWRSTNCRFVCHTWFAGRIAMLGVMRSI